MEAHVSCITAKPLGKPKKGMGLPGSSQDKESTSSAPCPGHPELLLFGGDPQHFPQLWLLLLSRFSHVRPHRQQPTRLACPWDSPGKNTGVGCHFLLQCMEVRSESEVAQSCPTLSDPMDCSLPGSSAHGIFQARVLEWGAIAFSQCGPSEAT